MKVKLTDIHKEFEKYIVIKDKWIIEVIFSNLIGNFVIHQDPIWLMLVAPSSGGKTTLINPCRSIGSVHFMDDLTEKTFLSGFKPGKGKPETSFLTTIGNGMIMVSDFTSIMSKNPVSRGEILGQMRCIYDGELIKRTGTGVFAWKGKIGFLGAATPEIYSQLESGRAMGERFVYYWIEQPTNEEISKKQAEAKASSRDIASALEPLYKDYCQVVSEYAQMVGIPPLTMTERQSALIHEAADFCVNGKATVHTDFKSGKVDQIPNKAGVGRDNKMFESMLHSLQLINCYENDDATLPVQDWMVEIIQKIAYSSVNRERRMILEILSESEEPMTSSTIGAKMGIEKTGVELSLAPLHAVGLVQKRIRHTDHRWFIPDRGLKTFIKNVSETMRYIPPILEEQEKQTDEQIRAEENAILDDIDKGSLFNKDNNDEAV